MINGFEISFLTNLCSCTLFNFEWFFITILGIVIFFKTIFWQWHIIFRNKVVIFYTALTIFYQIFFPISVKQQHVTPIKTTTLYLKILLDSDWKARLTDKNKNIVAKKQFLTKKLFYCNLLTLIRFFNIRVRRKKTKNYYYQHDEALKKKETIFFRKLISFCAWWNCLSKMLQNLPLFLDNSNPEKYYFGVLMSKICCFDS